MNHNRLKVLFLAPPSKKFNRIVHSTFITDEIMALANSGIEAYVISPLIQEDYMHGKIYMKAIPSPISIFDKFLIFLYLIRHYFYIILNNPRGMSKYFYHVCIEFYASRLVKSAQINLVHSHFAYPGGLGGMSIKAATSKPVINQLRGAEILTDVSINYGKRRNNAIRNLTTKRLLVNSDEILCNTEFMKNEAIKLGASQKKITIIRKGVDLQQFSPEPNKNKLREELKIKSRYMILTVAGLIPRKGINFILQALANLTSEYDFTFIVCGEGYELEQLKNLTQKLSLENQTRFMGKIPHDQIPKFFAAADIFILASIMEAAGNVLLESLASGCPIICTDAGGPPEYVQHGITGFVVPTRDSNAIAEKIRLLLDDPLLRESMSKKCRLIATQEYDYLRMIGNILSVYEKVLYGNKPVATNPIVGDGGLLKKAQ